MNANIMGLNTVYEDAYNLYDRLPIFLPETYSFVSAAIGGHKCTLISPRGELAPVRLLERHLKIIGDIGNNPVVLRLKAISPYKRRIFIEKRIPFITDRQVYLPFIYAYLTVETVPEYTGAQKLRASAQQIALLYMYGDSPLYLSDAAHTLGMTPMTASRGARQIEATGLFSIRKDGASSVITSEHTGRKLFDMCAAHMSSPVRYAGYIDKSLVDGNMLLAGDSLLSERTMLSPGITTTYAVYGRSLDKRLLSDELLSPERQVRLELWKYEPALLSDGPYADVLSVALSLADSKDERIGMAVNEMLEGVFRA